MIISISNIIMLPLLAWVSNVGAILIMTADSANCASGTVFLNNSFPVGNFACTKGSDGGYYQLISFPSPTDSNVTLYNLTGYANANCSNGSLLAKDIPNVDASNNASPVDCVSGSSTNGNTYFGIKDDVVFGRIGLYSAEGCKKSALLGATPSEGVYYECLQYRDDAAFMKASYSGKGAFKVNFFKDSACMIAMNGTVTSFTPSVDICTDKALIDIDPGSLSYFMSKSIALPGECYDPLNYTYLLLLSTMIAGSTYF